MEERHLPNGPVSAPLTVIARDVDGCDVQPGSLLVAPSETRDYEEHVAFPVDESALRRLAAAYGPDQLHHAWLYKVKAQSGAEYTDGFLPAEAKGLLERMDEWQAAHKLAHAQ